MLALIVCAKPMETIDYYCSIGHRGAAGPYMYFFAELASTVSTVSLHSCTVRATCSKVISMPVQHLKDWPTGQLASSLARSLALSSSSLLVSERPHRSLGRPQSAIVTLRARLLARPPRTPPLVSLSFFAANSFRSFSQAGRLQDRLAANQFG